MAAPPRVAFFGVGGLGGWLAARLLAAGAETAEVVLIARGLHGAAIREGGLRLRVLAGSEASGATALTAAPGAAEVYASVEEALAQGARPVDFVILAVKTWQVAEAARAASALLAPGGCVVTTQNGVEAPHQAAEAVGFERVLGGVAKVLAWISQEPGVVEMKVAPASFYFGEVFDADGNAAHVAGSLRVERLAAAFALCHGVDSGVPPAGTWPLIWEKAVLMCAMGPVGALCRAPLDKLCSIPETRAMLRDAMPEVARCAHAGGGLSTGTDPDSLVEKSLAMITKQGEAQPGITPSTLRDVVMGKPSEINELSGGIVRAGKKFGVPTPTHSLILAALLPQELRARNEQPYSLLGVPGGAPHVIA